MTTKEAIADVNVIIKDLSVMSDTDMITDEGIKTLKALQHLIDIAKRFEGAVEVDEVTTDSDNVQDYFKIVMHSEVSPFKPIGTSKTHKLYAIPKPKENK